MATSRYQCFDTPRGWEVCGGRRFKLIKTFNSGDAAKDKDDAVKYVQSLVEDDRWNAANRD